MVEAPWDHTEHAAFSPSQFANMYRHELNRFQTTYPCYSYTNHTSAETGKRLSVLSCRACVHGG